MAKSITIISFFVFLISCSANRKILNVKTIPPCLQTKTKEMAEDPNEGSPYLLHGIFIKIKLFIIWYHLAVINLMLCLTAPVIF